MKTLVISGHPHLETSIANATIIEELKKVPDLEIRNLGALYPDYRINTAEEQKAMLNADLIIWQFPVYWYGLPSIMKKWQEEVLTHGFAYGSNAKLGGKKLIISATTGSTVDAYQPDGAQNKTLDTLFAPLYQCADMCRLEHTGTFHLGGILYIPGVTGEDEKDRMKERAREHAAKMIKSINTL